MDDIRIRPDQLDEGGSKLGVSPGELDRYGWEDRPEVPPVLEVSGAKEGGTESPICECPLGGRLCDRSLARPGEPIQPVDRGFVFVGVVNPELDLVQDCCTRSLQATAAFGVLIPGFFCISDVVENIRFGCGSFFQAIVIGNVRARRCSNLGPAGRSFRAPKRK